MANDTLLTVILRKFRSDLLILCNQQGYLTECQMSNVEWKTLYALSLQLVSLMFAVSFYVRNDSFLLHLVLSNKSNELAARKQCILQNTLATFEGVTLVVCLSALSCFGFSNKGLCILTSVRV